MATTPIIPTISDDDFATASALVIDILSQQSPALNLTPGSALDGLVVTNEARLAAVHTADLTNLSNSFSLAAIAANIATVTDAQVDSLISDYFITRTVASPASGPVEVIADIAVPYSIPSGFTFTFGSQSFVTTQTWNIYPPSSSLSNGTTTRVMTQRLDGTFQFAITVTASVAGAAGELAAGTALTIANPLNGMVSASVAADFLGGLDTESNADLLARAQEGVTPQVSAGPDSIQALTVGEFPGVTTSVVGLGDPLMVRDRANILGISSGGKQDVYCRTSATTQLITKTYTGSVIDATARTVTLTVAYADGVGAYRVPFVRPHGSASVGGIVPTVTVTIYPNTPYRPLVLTALDAAFSASQILVLTLVDDMTLGALTTGQQISYDVDIEYMPTIGPITAFLTAAGTRSAGQDFLVRAAVPAEVTVTATLRIPAAGAQPDLSAIQIAVAAAINAIPMRTPTLGVYTVYSAIFGVLGVTGSVVDATLRAVIEAPSGASLVLTSAQQITIPLDVVNLVGPQNTFFCCAPSQVGLTVVSF